MKPDFKLSTTRWVLVNGINSINVDLAPHVLDEIGSNGDEVEILFTSREQAEEYAAVACLDDYRPAKVSLTYIGCGADFDADMEAQDTDMGRTKI